MRELTALCRVTDEMIRNYKYKLKLNKEFLNACELTLEGCRELYNAALYQRKDAYHVAGISLTWAEQCRELTRARELPEVAAILRRFQTNALKRLDQNFKAFFRRVKKKGKAGFPRYQSKDRYDSFSTADTREFRLDKDKLRVQKLGSVRLRLSRPLGGTPKQLTIKKEHDGWYAIFSCEVDAKPLPKIDNAVGVDLGVESFVFLSNGEHVENPRFFSKGLSGLSVAQRRFSLKKSGSLSFQKEKHAVQAWCAKIRRQRDWFHWHVARILVSKFDKIVVEDLNVGPLTKTYLAKSIQDVGWSSFINKLLVKAEEAARTVVKVNARYTSQDCSGCGKRRKKELSERWHSCECGLELHRDHNSALVILGRAFPANESKQILALDS